MYLNLNLWSNIFHEQLDWLPITDNAIIYIHVNGHIISHCSLTQSKWQKWTVDKTETTGSPAGVFATQSYLCRVRVRSYRDSLTAQGKTTTCCYSGRQLIKRKWAAEAIAVTQRSLLKAAPLTHIASLYHVQQYPQNGLERWHLRAFSVFPPQKINI